MSSSGKVLKRKAPPQSSTLLNFFNPKAASKNDLSSNAKKLKSTGNSVKKEFRPIVRSSIDVIVIDSDEDDDAVTIVHDSAKAHGHPVPCKISPSNIPRSLSTSPIIHGMERSNSSQVTGILGAESNDRDDSWADAFGEASLLSFRSSQKVPNNDISFMTPTGYSTSSSQADVCLDFRDTKQQVHKPESPPLKGLSTSLSKPFDKVEDAVILGAGPLDIDDGFLKPIDGYFYEDFDWGVAMRDDEMREDMEEPLEEYDLNYMENIEVEKPQSSKDDNEGRACPICARAFSCRYLSEYQKHVNWCMDRSASTCNVQRSRNASPKLNKSRLSPSNSVLSNSNAFSVLMTSHTENNMWAEAQAHDSKAFRPTRGVNGKRRKAPFYKVLQGMPIAVDAFRYGEIPGVNAYFLTHAHSDHYTNLSSNWKNGFIYCSETTANLVIHMLAVDRKWVRPLPMNEPTLVPDSGGVIVTLIEANHCPGSCLFLFEGPQTINAGDSAYKSSYIGSSRIFRYLHCGDFRACPQHVLHPAIKGKKLDCVYLDTTYLDPKYCFPPQPLVISACAELAKRLVAGETEASLSACNKANQSLQDWIKVDGKDKGKQKINSSDGVEKVLVVIGTYSIGKERIVKAVAKALQTKIYCDTRKAAILRCESDPELHSMLTNDPLAAGVHLVPLGMISSDQFKHYMERWKGKFSRAIGFRPTGWTYVPPAGAEQCPGIPSIIARDQARTFTYTNLRPMRNSTPNLTLYGVPYSEHSSFFELTCFALSLNWVKIVATVNVHSQTSRGKIAKWIEKWEGERRKRCKEGNDGNDKIVQFRAMEYW